MTHNCLNTESVSVIRHWAVEILPGFTQLKHPGQYFQNKSILVILNLSPALISQKRKDAIILLSQEN